MIMWCLLRVTTVVLISALALATGLEEHAKPNQDSVQSFLREPFDQIATVGEHVTLPCRVVNKQGTLQWTRDDFGLGVHRDLEGFKRYSMTGSDEEGDFTLDINPVQLEDDARFQCQVGASHGVLPIRSRYAALTVLVPPKAPVLTAYDASDLNGSRNNRVFAGRGMVRPYSASKASAAAGGVHITAEGGDIELRCVSEGGKPASEITWLDGSNSVVVDGVQTVQELMSDGKRFITTSLLRLRAERKHNGKQFTCQAQNSADRQPHSAKITLKVYYPPHVTLISDRSKLLEGESARFECSADANPDAKLVYEWWLGGRKMSGQTGSRLTVEGVDRRLNERSVRCRVSNEVGSGEASTVLNVTYSPVFLTRPEETSGMSGERVTLRCLVDSNPPVQYAWYRQSTAKGGVNAGVINRSPNLTFVVSPNTIGDYVCRAEAAGGGESVEAAAAVRLKGPPRVLNGGRPQHATVSAAASSATADAQVVCDMESVPPPDVVQWSFKGVDIDEDGRKYVIEQQKLGGGLIRSTLTVRAAHEEDLGRYVCTVANPFGTDSGIIMLRKQTSMPLLVIMAGAMGGVILTVALVMVAVLCRRNLAACLNLSAVARKKAAAASSSMPPPPAMLTVHRTKTGKVTTTTAASSSAAAAAVAAAALPQDSSGSEKASSSTTSDGVSNNSSELKGEVRTSSSLSGGENWEEDEHQHVFGGSANTRQTNRQQQQSRGPDVTDSCLPRPFEHQNYVNEYGHNSYAGASYGSSVAAPYGTFNRALATSARPIATAGNGHLAVVSQPSQTDFYGSGGGILSGISGGSDRNGGYSVHVRSSPISPASSGLSSVHAGGGISVKAGGYFGGGSGGLNHSDYVPASAFCVGGDDYSVYVNNNRHQPPPPPFPRHHEVIVPAVHKAASSAAANGGGSLATHV